MKRSIKKLVCLCGLLIILHTGFAQTQDAATLHETARSLMRQGDFANAQLVLDKALFLKPDDLDLLKDKAFIFYLQRDFTNSIDIGKKITARADADVQSIQILGLAYKGIGEDKESDKMYKAALKKFPTSGVLYSEYGELVSSNSTSAVSIKLWEKGIEVDPNYSGNYYYAAKYYGQKGNIIWGLLYSEIFVNIESLTPRTAEIKKILFNGYQALFSDLSILNNAIQNGTTFEKAVAENLTKLTGLMVGGATPETLTAMRTRFILNWYTSDGKQLPFHLFEFQRYLLQEGYFNAYDQWLVGADADTQQFQIWMQNHPDEVKGFQQYQKSVVFKLPLGQYYIH